MRIVLILLMCCGVAFGQDTTKYFKSVDYGWNWQRGKFRGGLILPTDTTNNKLGIAQIGANCFAWSGLKWNPIGSTDTAFLVRYYRKNQVDSAIAANSPALTLQDVTTNGKTTTDSIIAASFKRTGGTSSQFLKANGSVDNSTYLTSATLADSVSALRTAINTKGSGTVTSIATGLGLSGGTITSTGTLIVDTASTSIISRQRATATYLPLIGGTLTSRLTGTSLILNKDSLPTVTNKTWGLVVDTSNSNRISRRLLPIQIDSTERAYTETITYTGTAPSGTTNHTYEWSRNGRLVTFRINIFFGTAGALNTKATIPFPSVMPAPATVTGFTVSNISRMIPVIGNGGNSTTFANSLPSAIVFNAGTPAISVDAAAQNLQVIQVSGSYFTNN